LLATCDGDYNFTTIDVGAYGKQSDGGIFKGSTLGKKLSDGSLNICEPRALPGTESILSCFFVGDEAFPLSTTMMRPFPGRGLTTAKRIFNYRLSRARRCIENAFGIMSARFRIFRKPIAAHPKQAEYIVLGEFGLKNSESKNVIDMNVFELNMFCFPYTACVALHNFLKKEEQSLNPVDRAYCPVGFGDDSGDNMNGEWRLQSPSNGLMSDKRLSLPAQEKKAKEMRDKLMCYTLNEGAVDWQASKIGL